MFPAASILTCHVLQSHENRTTDLVISIHFYCCYHIIPYCALLPVRFPSRTICFTALLLEKLSHSAIQEISCLLWNPKVHYPVFTLITILSQMHPADTFPLCFPKIHSNIVFLSTSRYSAWPLPFRFSDQNFVGISHLSYSCYMSRSSHHPELEHPTEVM